MIPQSFYLWNLLVCVKTKYTFFWIGRRVSLIAKLWVSCGSLSVLSLFRCYNLDLCLSGKFFSSSFVINAIMVQFNLAGGGGGEERSCLYGNLWYSPPASMTSRLASVIFKMASKVFIEETDKNFDFITEILFRFLGFGDFKVSIVIENQT